MHIAVRLVSFGAWLIVALTAGAGLAQEGGDRRLALASSPLLSQNGFLDYILPRFSLKTRVRVSRQPLGDVASGAGDAQLILAPTDWFAAAGLPGRPVFTDGAVVFALSAPPAGSAGARRFADWLLGDNGMRAVTAFIPAESKEPLYRAVAAAPEPDAGPAIEGDRDAGARLSLALCGRCHVIGEINRTKGLGSTPSFGMLRNLANWEDRFRSFFVRNPHPAFTQIAEITPPFDEARPPPIAPLRMTIDDLDAILAYVAEIPPADLGAPVKHQ